MSELESNIPISVVMRSYNDAKLLPRTLAGLEMQEGVDVQLIVMESASTDDSLKRFETYGEVDILERLAPGSYKSSIVLNRGVFLAEHELVAFLNSDAILTDPLSLRRLADAIRLGNKVAGAFGRQLPRPNADAMTKLDYYIAFDNREWMGEFADAMSLVISMVSKSVWSQVPFDERLTFAEDAVWTREVHKLGYQTVYVEEATAEHSHNYTWKERYRRHYGDAAAYALALEEPPSRNLITGALVPFVRRVMVDSRRLIQMGAPLDAKVNRSSKGT